MAQRVKVWSRVMRFATHVTSAIRGGANGVGDETPGWKQSPVVRGGLVGRLIAGRLLAPDLICRG